MTQTRTFLLIAWFFVAALLWMEWGKRGDGTSEGGDRPTPSEPTPAAAAPLPASTPTPTPTPLPGAPAAPPPVPTIPSAADGSEAAAAPFVLENDVLRLHIAREGGRVLRAELLAYAQEKKPGSANVLLLDDRAGRHFSAAAGLLRLQGEQAQPLSLRFASASGQPRHALAAGATAATLVLQASDAASGVEVQRRLTLQRGSYVLEVSDAVGNRGAQAQRLYPLVSLQRVAPPAPPRHSFMTNPETFSFTGAAWFTPEGKYEKTPLGDFDNEAPPAGDVSGGWIAMLQHHFVSAWVPDSQEPQRFSTAVETDAGVPLYRVQSVGTALDIPAGEQRRHHSRLWVGPKLQAPMAQLDPNLTRSVDYGVFFVLASPLFWLLAKLHALLGNWGWAIIAIVILLKAALYWFSKKQYENMAKMRAIQPRLEALKERYGDDRQKFAMAQMELFQKEKINPLGGCLPMLIPIPIFLALYWVLLETVELRHAPWMGWIQNLTAPDPYFVLPALNLAVMYLTQKLTPTPGMDPMQKKMMQFMPLVFGVMMAFFPAGLVLYWVTNGALGLLQQWWMTRQHGEGKAVAGG